MLLCIWKQPNAVYDYYKPCKHLAFSQKICLWLATYVTLSKIKWVLSLKQIENIHRNLCFHIAAKSVLTIWAELYPGAPITPPPVNEREREAIKTLANNNILSIQVIASIIWSITNDIFVVKCLLYVPKVMLYWPKIC